MLLANENKRELRSIVPEVLRGSHMAADWAF